MEKQPLRIAVVGCGNIAGGYAKTWQPYEQIKLLGATDIDLQRAENFVASYGGRVYPSLDDILADENVDLVLNLTIHHAHFSVIQQCLLANKDVFSEKPLALSTEEAQTLVALAREKG